MFKHKTRREIRSVARLGKVALLFNLLLLIRNNFSIHAAFRMLQTANIAREIEGVQTDVLLQAFADRVLILVTQLGKVGSLVSFIHA